MCFQTIIQTQITIKLTSPPCLIFFSQALLFMAPAVFVGGMDGIHSRVAVLWSFSPALLHGSFGRHGDSRWLKWFVLYFLFVIGAHVAMGTLIVGLVFVFLCSLWFWCI
jgi:hypothetical protein